MLSRIHDIPLLILVAVAAGLAFLCWGLGFTFLTQPIMMGETFFLKSIAALAKDALFVPLKPLMYALIIMSIGSSLAISTGGVGAKFARVLGFFIGFSLLGILAAMGAFMLFSGMDIGLADPAQGVGSGQIKEMPFLWLNHLGPEQAWRLSRPTKPFQPCDTLPSRYGRCVDYHGGCNRLYSRSRHSICFARNPTASACRPLNI